MRIYQNDRVIFKNVTFYIGKVPVFWWPYLYQSLDRSFSYLVAPAYLSSWGPSLLGQITFPIGEKITSTVKLDYRTRRGVALGFDSEIRYGKDDNSLAKFSAYYLQDQNPDLNRTSLPRPGTPTSRYRFSLQDRTQITEDIEAIVDVTKLSDGFLLQDFFPAQFRVDPRPDNVVALTKTSPFYTLTAYGRFALNTFFETTERLPEVALDIKRHGLFGGPIFYEGETSVGELRRNFPANSIFQDYSAFRIDSFHQLTYPNTYFGFLAIVPRVGFRETYYDQPRGSQWLDFYPKPRSVGAGISSPEPLDQFGFWPAVKLREGSLPQHFQRGNRRLLQDLAGMGRRADPRARARWPAPHHSAVREFFLRLFPERRPRDHPPIRPRSAFDQTQPDRFPAIHFDRRDR